MTEYLIGLLELIEAEGRTLRQAVIRTGLSLGLLMVAVGLVLTGLGFLLASGYMTLAIWWGPSWAAFALGLVTLVLAAGLIWLAQRLSQSGGARA